MSMGECTCSYVQPPSQTSAHSVWRGGRRIYDAGVRIGLSGTLVASAGEIFRNHHSHQGAAAWLRHSHLGDAWLLAGRVRTDRFGAVPYDSAGYFAAVR